MRVSITWMLKTIEHFNSLENSIEEEKVWHYKFPFSFIFISRDYLWRIVGNLLERDEELKYDLHNYLIVSILFLSVCAVGGVRS